MRGFSPYAVVPGVQACMLGILYVFLYAPIAYVIYLSFVENSTWPFPPDFTLEWYVSLAGQSDFQTGLLNSVLIGVGAGAISTVFATAAAIGLLKYQVRGRLAMALVFLAPLFVANVLIGISTLMFYRGVLDLPGGLPTAIVANATYGIAFAFLVILAQLVRYDWRLDEAAMVFGASPARTFREITLPNIWPAVLGAFLVSFILAFNNLQISFYNLGATPTLPTIAWGTLRHGIDQELYALAAIVNALVFTVLIGLYILIRTERLRLGAPGK